ncbi:MAG: tRNA pseudouridine synthase A [Candidatus Lokiarchaeota archaeon]
MKTIKYFFKFYYIGKEKYFGSQRQPNFLTIEDKLIQALKNKNYITNSKTSNFQVASRTDRYVSARGAVFSIETRKKPILMEINSILPEEIGIWAKAKVSSEANPRYDALLRWYKYVLKYPVEYLNAQKFNFKIVIKACKYLEGTHNFQNYSKRSKKEQRYTRELYAVFIEEMKDYLVFNFKSQAFLRQQIRRIIAKLIQLGFNEIAFKDFKNLFDPSKFHSYQPAEPQGLILWEILYPEVIKFRSDKKSIDRMLRFFEDKKLEHGLKHQLFSLLEHNNSS